MDLAPAGIKLLDDNVIVGRSPTCGLILPDPSVSRRHAELTVVESVLTVRDLGSRNGTYVDVKRIESESVYFGQRLRFGSVSLWVGADDRKGGDADAELETRSAVNLFPLAATDPR